MVDSAYQEFTCGPPDNNCANTQVVIVRCRPTVKGDCEILCAAECGSKTSCIEGPATTCNDCCKASACSKYGNVAGFDPEIDADRHKSCMLACDGKCETNTQFCEIIKLLKELAMVIATVMFLINAIKLLISDDAEGRSAAKHALLYIIIGMILILVAAHIIPFLLGGNLACP